MWPENPRNIRLPSLVTFIPVNYALYTNVISNYIYITDTDAKASPNSWILCNILFLAQDGKVTWTKCSWAVDFVSRNVPDFNTITKINHVNLINWELRCSIWCDFADTRWHFVIVLIVLRGLKQQKSHMVLVSMETLTRVSRCL